MTTWTVHAREADLAAAVVGDRLKILPERFSWGAALVPFVWSLWNRLWLVFLFWLVATVAIELVDARASDVVGGVLSFAFLVWFALVAQDLHRWTLERRGWRLVAVVEARNRPEAEARFVDKLNAAAPAATPAGLAPLAPLPPLPPLSPFSGVTP